MIYTFCTKDKHYSLQFIKNHKDLVSFIISDSNLNKQQIFYLKIKNNKLDTNRKTVPIKAMLYFNKIIKLRSFI